MRLIKNEWYEIENRIVRIAQEITIELSPNIQEIKVYPTLIQRNKLVQGQTDPCIIAFYGNPSDITPINFWDLGNRIPWDVFKQLIMRYYSHEEILLEAKRRFPIGTKYYPAHISKASFIEPDANFIVGQDQSFILDHHSLNVDLQNPDKGYYSRERNGHAYNQVLFHNGEWARILNKPSSNYVMTKEEKLLAEAISKYPIGTKYIPLTDLGKTYSSVDIATVVRTPNGNSDLIEGGPGYLYANGIWAELVTVKTFENSIDYNALLKEAKRRYPKGTSYYPLDAGNCPSKRPTEVTKEAVWFEKKVDNSSSTPQDLIEVGKGYVYVDGKWAEIVENNIDYDAVLEEAKRKYPIGTKYMPLTSKGEVYDTGVKTSNREAHWYDRKSNGQDKDRIEIGYGFAYIDGKWAEVIEETVLEEPIVNKYMPSGTLAIDSMSYFPTEKLVARKEVLTKQNASQHKVEELPLLKIKKF